jgi:hypothetical protein
MSDFDFAYRGQPLTTRYVRPDGTPRDIILGPHAARIELRRYVNDSYRLTYVSPTKRCSVKLDSYQGARVRKWMEVNGVGELITEYPTHIKRIALEAPAPQPAKLRYVAESTPGVPGPSSLRTGASPAPSWGQNINSDKQHPEGGNDMSNQRHLLNLLQENMTTCVVHFIDQPTREPGYTYKVHKDWKVEAGDHLVVDSPKSGLTVVKVQSVDKAPRIDTDASFTYKWALQKVDRAFYDRQVEKERLFLEQLAEVDVIHKREAMMEKATKALGEGTPARAAFDAAVQQLSAE